MNEVEARAPAPSDQVPLAGERGVSLDSPVMVTFDRDLDPTSLDRSTFTLEHRLGRVAGVVSYDPDSHTGILEPAVPLAIGTRYTARVDREVRGRDGTVLGAPIEWSFETRGGFWDQPSPVADPRWSTSDPCAFGTVGGDVVAAWTRWDGRSSRVAWSRFDARLERWSKPEPVGSRQAGRSRAPDVAVNALGEGIVAWYQWDGFRFDVWAAPIGDVARGRAAAYPLSASLSGSASNPVVAIDPAGNAVVAWYQWDGRSSQVWASRRRSGQPVWDAPGLLSDPDQGSAIYPRVVMDTQGRATVVWWQARGAPGGPQSHVWARRHERGTGRWGDPVRLDRGGNARAARATVAMEPDGDVRVAWIERSGPRWSVWTRARDARRGGGDGKAWPPARRLFESGREIDRLCVAANSGGDVLAVWREHKKQSKIVRSRGRNGLENRWGPAVVLRDHPGDVRDLAASIDETGNAAVFWAQRSGTTFRCVTRHYRADDRDWTPVERIGLAEGQSLDPVVVPRAGGGVLVVYSQWGGKAQRIRARTLR